MEGNIVSGLVGAAGAYAAVWAHLGFVKWRLNEQRDLLIKHDDAHKIADKRLTYLEAHNGLIERRSNDS